MSGSRVWVCDTGVGEKNRSLEARQRVGRLNYWTGSSMLLESLKIVIELGVSC